jgi:hypothetical protein
LRQVTRDDVTGWLDGRKHQANDASALRDLFRTLKSERLVFTNPTDRVRVVKPNQTTPNRLTPETLQLIGRAVAQDPALLVVLALVGVHALGPRQGPSASPWSTSTWSTWICPTPASISAAPPGQWTRSPRTRSASTSPTGTIVGRAPATHLLVTRRTPSRGRLPYPAGKTTSRSPEGPPRGFTNSDGDLGKQFRPEC